MRDRTKRFEVWLEHLRSGDPMFATASALFPADMNEWQSAVYLLTGCDEVWVAVRAAVLADRSIAPIVSELEQPRRAWASSENAVMEWAAHFWDVDPLASAVPLRVRAVLLPALDHRLSPVQEDPAGPDDHERRRTMSIALSNGAGALVTEITGQLAEVKEVA